MKLKFNRPIALLCIIIIWSIISILSVGFLAPLGLTHTIYFVINNIEVTEINGK